MGVEVANRDMYCGRLYELTSKVKRFEVPSKRYIAPQIYYRSICYSYASLDPETLVPIDITWAAYGDRIVDFATMFEAQRITQSDAKMRNRYLACCAYFRQISTRSQNFPRVLRGTRTAIPCANPSICWTAINLSSNVTRKISGFLLDPVNHGKTRIIRVQYLLYEWIKTRSQVQGIGKNPLHRSLNQGHSWNFFYDTYRPRQSHTTIYVWFV